MNNVLERYEPAQKKLNMENKDVTEAHITEALKVLRALHGGEPYAASVMPAARVIAQVRQKEGVREISIQEWKVIFESDE